MEAERAPQKPIDAWKAAHPDEREPIGSETIRKKADGSVYRLVFATPPTGTIAKRGRRQDLAIERVIYEDVLAGLGVPVPKYHGSIADRSARRMWLFVEEVQGEGYSVDDHTHRVAAAEWLAALHTRSSVLAGRVGLPRQDADVVRSGLRASTSALANLADADLRHEVRHIAKRVTASLELVEELWDPIESVCDRWPLTLVHGDLGYRNVRVARAGSRQVVMPFDWEHGGWGLPLVDLAQRAGRSISADPATYASIARETWPDLSDDFVRWSSSSVGNLLWSLIRIPWYLRALEHGWVESAIRGLETYDEVVNVALAAMVEAPRL
jgi:hypothetical protein